ncbi:hypothetical protein J2S17_002375 [Cytobacillus purgationiresistens]|uniref:YuzL family protein n=1 Tax=Cytobacillus purgationiresistens TaxID=863449 RepID=A0ABU0AKC6_9BACI|nr:hypothetical protein [Cytobacillus purgationiresistens]
MLKLVPGRVRNQEKGKLDAQTSARMSAKSRKGLTRSQTSARMSEKKSKG